MFLNLNRVWAVVVRHMYHSRHSLDRLSDAFYWPAINIFIWGFTFSYIQTEGTNLPGLVSLMLSSMVLFMIVWEAQYEVTVNLLEELWNQNVVNLFASPLRLREWIAGVFVLGFIKIMLCVGFATLLTYFFYNTSIFKLGHYFLPFLMSLLITGWAFGLIVAGLIIYFGRRIQAFAWMGIFVIVPITGVYYPVSTLPVWAQKVAAFIPMSYIFEGMRSVILTGNFNWINFVKSIGLNVVFIIVGLCFFLFMFNKAKVKGLPGLE